MPTAMKEDELPSDHRVTLEAAGVKRSYIVHLPKGYDDSRKWPVVLMFHGGGSRAKDAMQDTGWAVKADREGFIAVFPEGTSPDPSHPTSFFKNPQTWNDGSEQPALGAAERGVPDIHFISAVIDGLKRCYKVDHRRVYATGFSNGASMVFWAARELSTQIAAFAPVAGHDWSSKKPARPVPVIYIVGAVDPLCPIEGGEIFIGKKPFGKRPEIRRMFSRWVELHGAIDTPRVTYDKDGAVGETYRLPNTIDSVAIYTIDGHGHYWPGGDTLMGERIGGKNTAQLNATDVIWNFFKLHSLPVG